MSRKAPFGSYLTESLFIGHCRKTSFNCLSPHASGERGSGLGLDPDPLEGSGLMASVADDLPVSPEGDPGAARGIQSTVWSADRTAQRLVATRLLDSRMLAL